MTKRTPFIAGNWKMFKTVHESVVYAKELRLKVKDLDEVEIVIAPVFTAVPRRRRSLPQQQHWSGRAEHLLGA